ncbi:MAG: hypothetical protein HUJ63_05095, partial [Enterococcus sp.]|nr:hypothetical protein [Enterococcus sp.]
MAEEKKVNAPEATEAKADVAAPKAKPAAKKSAGNKKASIQSRIRDQYHNEVKKALLEKYKYKSVMQIPALEKKGI